MDYKMRELRTKDIFVVSRLLKKMDLNLDFKGKDQEQLGGELLMSLFENLHMAEQETSEFFGGLVGITAEDFLNLPIDEAIGIIKLLMSQPGIADFFKRAGQLTK